MGSMLSKPKTPPPVKIPKVEAAPPPPAPEPVAVMPVPDDLATSTKRKKEAARRVAMSGRGATVLTGDGLGAR